MAVRVVLRFALCLLLAGSLSACASSPTMKSGTSRAVSTGSTLAPPDSSTAVGAYRGVSEYRIGGQDLIEISVFQVPDLNRTVRVNTGGQISLPLIGAMQAGGRTVQELESDIAAKLKAGYLQNPQVSVFVKEFTSQRVTVEGAVKKPGIFPISGKTTLLQAIAMSEGLDPLANLQGVVIFRVIDGKKMGARYDLKTIRAGDTEDPQIYGDDIIVVDQSGSKTALRRVLEAIPILNVFTIY
jgi:polysaccharide export outer membrane protein